MAKPEVILTHNIVGLGAEHDQVRVAAGYARNYLFPQGLAVPLTGANKRRIEVPRQRRAEREAHELNSMTELSKSLAKLVCVLTVKTGEDGKMFGTVTAGMIADQLKTQLDVTLDKRKIHLETAIRTLGEHDVELRLHQDVIATLKVRVESSTPLPEPAAAPAAEGRREGQRTEKRGRRPETAADKVPKVEASGEKPRTARVDRPPRGERPPRIDKAPKAEKAAKPEHPSSAEKSGK